MVELIDETAEVTGAEKFDQVAAIDDRVITAGDGAENLISETAEMRNASGAIDMVAEATVGANLRTNSASRAAADAPNFPGPPLTILPGVEPPISPAPAPDIFPGASGAGGAETGIAGAMS